MNGWMCAFELDSGRRVVDGSEAALCNAIGRGADLRIYTEFIHNEHIDVTSENAERIQEVAEFRVTYLLENRWAAGIMSLRQPIELPHGFGARASMSFFLYNQDGRQGIARPYLDGVVDEGERGPSPPEAPVGMEKYHAETSWDSNTNAPSTNFVYDFDVFRFNVNDSWHEMLSHDADGRVVDGSLDDLIEAFRQGCSLKVGIWGLCADLMEDGRATMGHEVFVEAGPGYYYTEQKLFMAGSHPVIRVKPNIPLQYESGGWDFGWLMVRTDGHVVYRQCDPYTLAFQDVVLHLPVRWFVR